MNLIGATVRYPITGCQRAEQSKIEKTMRTHSGELAFKCSIGKSINEVFPETAPKEAA
ncbi:MAG: hypothetical protein PHO83_16745 [Geobacteraceae bacterium]|nr:hypothetical protein [Geobacteraceae bacterium]